MSQVRDHDTDHNPHDDHQHLRGGLGGLLHRLVPHSHDTVDSLDTELQTSIVGIRTVKVSLVALVVTAVFQIIVVWYTGSVALLADTIHNFSDALTAIPLWIAFALTVRPPTKRFTYGLGRVEDLGGLFVLAMILLSAIVAAYEAVDRLLHPQLLSNLWSVVAAGIIGFLGNELVAIYRTRVGRQIGSAALIADGAHARVDGITSLAVVAGAIGVAAGFPRADPLIGLIIAVVICGILVRTGKDVMIRLLDGVDPKITDAVRHELERTHGVRGVADVRVRWVGHVLTAEATIELDPDVSLAKGDDIAHHAEHHLVHHVHRLRRATIHAAPQGAHHTSHDQASWL